MLIQKFLFLFFPHRVWISFLSGTGTPKKEMRETKDPILVMRALRV
jgi:hypothetical protein